MTKYSNQNFEISILIPYYKNKKNKKIEKKQKI